MNRRNCETCGKDKIMAEGQDFCDDCVSSGKHVKVMWEMTPEASKAFSAHLDREYSFAASQAKHNHF